MVSLMTRIRGRLLRIVPGVALILMLILQAVPALLGGPLLKELRPSGAQRGKAFTLTLVGKGLDQGVTVVSDLPATFTPLTAPQSTDGDETLQEVLFLVELSPAAPVGLYPLRAVTAAGLSNLLLFSVGAFTEVTEQESARPGESLSNDSHRQSEPISIPVTVNGTLEGPERDVYQFQASRNQRLVIEIEARRNASGLDPVIRLLDSQGRQLAWNDDAPDLGVDPRLEFTFPADGTYHVVVHDAKFSQQDLNFYRLKIGAFSYAQGVFPLGGRRGEKTKVQLLGGNLPEPTSVTVDLREVEKDVVMIPIPGNPGSLPIAFAVDDLPQAMETSDREIKSLTAETWMHGRISDPGQIDRYHLEVEPDQEWLFELKATELRTSQLMGRLSLLDEEGVRLASAGDDIPSGGNSFLIQLGRTSPEPHLQFKVPPDVHRIVVAVEDLLQRGGDLFAYRLLARKQPPDFTVRLDTIYLNVPQGGSAVVSVTTNDRGYSGPIQLDIPNAPDGLIVEGGLIPQRHPGIGAGLMTITARKGAEAGPFALSVRAVAQLPDGSQLVRWPTGPGMKTPVLPGTGLPDTTFPRIQETLTAPWLDLDLPVMVSKAVPCRLEVDLPEPIRMVQGMTYDLKWRFESDDPAIGPPASIQSQHSGGRELRLRPVDSDAPNRSSGIMKVITTIGTPAMVFNTVLFGEVEIEGIPHNIYTPLLTMEIVKGYEIVVPQQGVTLYPGSRAELVGRVQRDPLFKEAVTLKPENSPPGVFCESTQVAGSEEIFRIPCRATSMARVGEYTIDLTSTSTLAEREKEKVPYSIPAVPARLTVSPVAAANRAPQAER